MNMERFSESKPVLALTTAQGDITTATTTLGEAIDCLGYNSLTIPINVSDVTAGQIDSITAQESADGVTYAAIPDDSLFYPGSFPIDAPALVHVGVVAKKRYVKLAIVTSTGTTVDITVDQAHGLLQDSEAKPPVKESSTLDDSEVISPAKTADAETTHPKRT